MGKYDDLLTEDMPEPTPAPVQGKYSDLLEAQPTQGKYADLLEGSEPEQSPTPETDEAVKQTEMSALGTEIQRLAQTPSPKWLQGFESAAKELIQGIPSMATQFVKSGIQGAKFAAGGPQEKNQVISEVLKQALPGAAQNAQDLKAPIGSHEWWRGTLNMAQMALPALELLRGAPAVPAGEVEKPPIQGYSAEQRGMTPTPTTIAGDISRAMAGPGWERRFQMVDQPETQLAAAPDLEASLESLGGKRFSTITAEGEIPQRPPEERFPSETARIGGEPDASRIASTESVPEYEIRPPMGEEAPLRQQGETPETRTQPRPAGQSVAPPAQAGSHGQGVRHKITVSDLSDINAKGVYHPISGEISLSRKHLSELTPEQRASLVRHELAHKIETESELWKQSDTYLWNLWEQDRRNPIWDFMNENTVHSRMNNNASSEILAELYADHYPTGKFTVRERPVPYENEPEISGPTQYQIPPELMDVLNKIEGKLGIWKKKLARGPLPKPIETIEPNAPRSLEADLGKPPVQEVSPNVKGFEKIYGKGAIPAGEVLSPEEEFTAAQNRAASGKARPYDFIDRARKGAITSDELGDLVYEHDRLVNEAAAAEGTPQYNELYDRAQTFAQNVLKPAETAWGRSGRVMQIKAPIDYSRLTGFRQAVEKRFGREMLLEEQKAAEKMKGDVDTAKKETGKAVSEGLGNAIKRFKGVKDLSFEDAVKGVHDALEEAAKPCKI